MSQETIGSCLRARASGKWVVLRGKPGIPLPEPPQLEDSARFRASPVPPPFIAVHRRPSLATSPISRNGTQRNPLDLKAQACGSRTRQRQSGISTSDEPRCTLKEQLLWIRTFADLDDLNRALQEFRLHFNQHWLIQRHGHRSPSQVRQDLLGRGAAA